MINISIDPLITNDEIAWCTVKIYFDDKRGEEYHYQETHPFCRDQVEHTIKIIKRGFSDTEWGHAKRIEVIREKNIGKILR
jgi:hypothetical protein